MSLSFYEVQPIQKFLCAAGIILLLIVFKKRVHRLPLPPGPQGYPLIGNAFNIPSKFSWLVYHEWSKHFGDVLHLSALGQSIIILNSAQSIFDLLERRSASYSGRPWAVMSMELVGYKDSPVMVTNGPRHRTYRRLYSEMLSPKKVEEWIPLQEQKVQVLSKGLAEAPKSFRAHIRKYIASLVFEISHGHIIEGDDDPFIRLAKQIVEDFSELIMPGKFLVDVLPFLRYIPECTGISFQKKARLARETLEHGLDYTFQQVKDQIAAGTALPSFTSSMIERTENPTEENINIYKWASFVFYLAGADTSVSVLESFMLAMALHPIKQRKAQAEIDSVIGPERLPTFKDRLSLPYVESVIKEVYRWNPVGPIAIPHSLSSDTDDEYRGWRIPRGSVVIANTWAVLHDTNLYPFPFEFFPERYLEQAHDTSDETSLDSKVLVNPDPRKFAFGYGRRICPGKFLIDDTIFIAIVTILALFDVGPLTSGETPKYTPYLISRPEAFACDITPRSKLALDL